MIGIIAIPYEQITCGWRSVPILEIAVLPGDATLILKAADP
jgi:hypothetical protein